MYIKRDIEKIFNKLKKEYPVIMICGSRQVGKSTLLNHMKESNRKYVTLDDFGARKLAIEDPTLFLETYKAPLIIDEFQYAPELLSVIKMKVDEKNINGEDSSSMYWLTGSQQFKMMKNISESLAGRVAILDLFGLSKTEIEEREEEIFHPLLENVKKRINNHIYKDINQIYEMIFKGGMPKLITSNIEKDRYYMDYVKTYIERDIRDLTQVGNLNSFYTLLIYLAARTSQELNYADASKQIGISAVTIKQWITILEGSGIIYLLQPFSNNMSKRLIKSPKIYFMDTGLCTYLCKWPNYETLMNSNMDGAILETYIVSEIIKSYCNHGKSLNLFYYRDKDQKEIDLLVQEINDIYPIEIKKNYYPSNANKNFRVLNKYNLTVKTGLIICMTKELMPLNKETWLCPISIL